jgi:HSP20 family protein
MQLVRHIPRNTQAFRHNNLNNFFDDLFGPAFYPDNVLQKDSNRSLHVDIYEKDNTIIIEAELPGIPKEDIKLDVKGKLVTLGGERRFEEEIQEEHRYRKERTFGKFERSFSMPFEIDTEKVVATHENGILRLEIPKPEEKQSRKIAIN